MQGSVPVCQERKVAIFDMDNTILQGRFIDCVAVKYGFSDELHRIRKVGLRQSARAQRIAGLLSGLSYLELIRVAQSIAVVPDAAETVRALEDMGYITGIISDSYDFVAHHVKDRLGMSFALANALEFRNGFVTGNLKVPSYFHKSSDSGCSHEICKGHAVDSLARAYGADLMNSIAVGDSEGDACMVSRVGIGVSFQSKDAALLKAARYHITDNALYPVLRLAVSGVQN